MLIKINCVCHNDNLAWKSIQSSIIERGNADYCNIITSSQMNILSHNANNITKTIWKKKYLRTEIQAMVFCLKNCSYCEQKLF